MLIKQSAMQSAAYRLNFWMICATNIAYFGVQLAFMSVIFQNTGAIGNWSKYEMFFYIGTYNILDALWVFGPFFNLVGLPGIINSGDLDYYIVKPLNSQFLVSLRKMEISALMSLMAGIAIAGYSLAHMGRTLSVARLLLYAFTLLNAVLIEYSFFLILCCLSFWLIKADYAFELDGIAHYFISRPADIYKGALKFILYFIIPYGIMMVMASKSAIKNITLPEYCVFLAVAWAFFGFSILFWKCSVKRYSSASS